MDNLSTSQIESILFDVLPDECELTGDANVRSVSELTSAGQTVAPQPPSRDGYRTDAAAALLAVAAAANFIKTCVDLYFALKKAKATKPTEADLYEKAVGQSAGVAESAAKLASAVYKALTA